ncbi:MAG TPA: glycosyltransferase family 9 protein [Phycisphaerales bacterium]|nr:glycosyltransferase family 9 protein [Phycisphaerales bacterium]HMP35949.1 glycosyltransferase family 9 protein [Phycisphaerales bacterium]
MPSFERILLIRPSALGDVCRTVPVLASLRRGNPGARIDWVVNEAYVDAIAHHPALTAAIPFPRARFAKFWRSPALATEIWRWAVALRRTRYDLVIDCQGLGRSGLIAWATGSRLRVGYADAREAGWLGYNRRVEVPRTLHAVDRMLALAVAADSAPQVGRRAEPTRAAGQPQADEHRAIRPVAAVPQEDVRLAVPPAGAAWLQRYRRQIDLAAEEPYAVLAPTARWMAKRWPAAHWAKLAGPLVERGFSRIFLIGSQSERTQVGEALPPPPLRNAVVNLVGRTNLRATMALIAGAALVVANDSAPLHIAVGFDRPLVGLFGPTDPDLVGPYGRREWVIRPPLDDDAPGLSFKDPAAARIMEAISVREVVAMIDRVLADRAGVAAATATAVIGTAGDEGSRA